MNKENIQEVKKLLSKIHEKGFEIANIIKQKNNYISTKPKEEILIDPELFSYYLFDLFWKLFKRVSENIENPLVQPWIRIVIEQASDFIWCSKNKDNDIACKYWLCHIGFVGGKQKDLEYDNFLELLLNQKTKAKFLTLKDEGYPKKKIHDEIHNLFPAINEKNLPSFIERYFLNVRGDFIKKEKLDMLYRDMSFYHHPSLLMNKIDYEFEDKSHLFRCFILISLCGMSLIKYASDEIIKNSGNSFDDLTESVNSLIKGLYNKNK